MNWVKLKYLLGYLWFTWYLLLIIVINENRNIIIYIDGTHAIYAAAKRYSRLFIMIGKGVIINVSKKLELIMTSSTETEVVSSRKRFLKYTWFWYFRLVQGEEAYEDILMQDNKSLIILYKNYLFSIGKGMKHINIYYFFVLDKL